MLPWNLESENKAKVKVKKLAVSHNTIEWAT